MALIPPAALLHRAQLRIVNAMKGQHPKGLSIR